MIEMGEFFFHFSCPLGPKSLYSNSLSSTTKLKTLCVKFINSDFDFKNKNSII